MWPLVTERLPKAPSELNQPGPVSQPRRPVLEPPGTNPSGMPEDQQDPQRGQAQPHQEEDVRQRVMPDESPEPEEDESQTQRDQPIDAVALVSGQEEPRGALRGVAVYAKGEERQAEQ